MLLKLPVEILLEIIQCLPFTSLRTLPSLSKSWATFMGTNEPSIYHDISRQYGYANPDTAPPSEGWKAWFMHKLHVELRWMGKIPGNSYRFELPGEPRSVYKIKVDEEAGYVINTFTGGGLTVSDIHNHRILWALDKEYCEPLSRCEYDKGYIVFSRRSDGFKEVWRRRADVLGIPEDAWPSELDNKPDEHMLKARLVVEDLYLDDSRMGDLEHLRGQFIPWARLLIPEDIDDGHTFKLNRGTLLAFNAEKVFLYDIEKAELQQTVEVTPVGNVRYVDVSEQHVFILSPMQLSVYDRVSGLHVLSIPSGRLPWDFYASPENQWRRTEETFNHGELGFRRAVPQTWAHREDYFDAVHVSSCGKHLAIMAMSNRVIIIQDFWRLVGPSKIMLKQIAKQIDFYVQRPSLPTETETCLAYDCGKVAIFGALGIYVLVLDSILDQLGDIDLPSKDPSLRNLMRPSEHEQSWPNLRLRKVIFYDLQVSRGDILSCLQLSKTKLYLSVISVDPLNERSDNMWCYDFASPPRFTPAKAPWEWGGYYARDLSVYPHPGPYAFDT
ncbi:hypothetical protein BJ322DRAFT_513946 [Thelephora terrestris]|uniref:F-box domain-containing protein n=1 Tax=Thelephora terrestris TaxID=56493 RepID=A0A9P6H238_9AGAM|nr:hypothetical protein BJ322DRAFT_513946 [Thelephora terrestris]